MSVQSLLKFLISNRGNPLSLSIGILRDFALLSELFWYSRIPFRSLANRLFFFLSSSSIISPATLINSALSPYDAINLRSLVPLSILRHVHAHDIKGLCELNYVYIIFNSLLNLFPWQIPEGIGASPTLALGRRRAPGAWMSGQFVHDGAVCHEHSRAVPGASGPSQLHQL